MQEPPYKIKCNPSLSWWLRKKKIRKDITFYLGISCFLHTSRSLKDQTAYCKVIYKPSKEQIMGVF
jgi:hypothetical protein